MHQSLDNEIAVVLRYTSGHKCACAHACVKVPTSAFNTSENICNTAREETHLQGNSEEETDVSYLGDCLETGSEQKETVRLLQ